MFFCVLISSEQRKPGYGAVESSNSSVIYCVHGKPNALCCDDEKGGKSSDTQIQISKLPLGSQRKLMSYCFIYNCVMCYLHYILLFNNS